jgi:hypothetical protein
MNKQDYVERMRASCESWIKDLRKTPKALRESGPCEVDRTASFNGVPYDPGLVSDQDLQCFLENSEKMEDEATQADHLKRLIRHTERVRSDEMWPESIREHVESIDYRPIEEQLGALIPGTERFMSKLSYFRKNFKEQYENSPWKGWYRAYLAEKEEEKKRRADYKNSQEWRDARNKRRRELRAEKNGFIRKAGRPKTVMLNENKRWVAVLDRFATEFIKKSNAYKWAAHLVLVQAGKAEKDEALLAKLVDSDRNGGVRDRKMSENAKVQ